MESVQSETERVTWSHAVSSNGISCVLIFSWYYDPQKHAHEINFPLSGSEWCGCTLWWTTEHFWANSYLIHVTLKSIKQQLTEHGQRMPVSFFLFFFCIYLYLFFVIVIKIKLTNKGIFRKSEHQKKNDLKCVHCIQQSSLIYFCSNMWHLAQQLLFLIEYEQPVDAQWPRWDTVTWDVMWLYVCVMLRNN